MHVRLRRLVGTTALVLALIIVPTVGAHARSGGVTADLGTRVANAPSSQSSSTAPVGDYLLAGSQAYFAVNGGRIWSQPGRGVIRGLGYRGQGFCVDGQSGSYYHGRNQATGVVGWTHYTNVNYNPAIGC